ncbi:hypothetical protein MMC32_006283 [Xylographa parallela]|nr:hypothetical protein [Xylographa parallela]
MPYLDSTDGEWYLKQVISICDQARKTDIDARIFAINGMLHADSQLVLDILTNLRVFLDCCRPFKDVAYIKVTTENNVLHMALIARVDDEGCKIITERIKRFGNGPGHGTVDVVRLDTLSPAERAATIRLIALS